MHKDIFVSPEDKDKMKFFYEEIERIKDRIAKERDRLRDLISEAEDTLNSVDDYMDLQTEALDILSQTL